MKLENLVFDFDKFASEMANLKEKKHFDYLVTIVGEDFGDEEGLGCIYILENTDTRERTSVKMLAKQVGEEDFAPRLRRVSSTSRLVLSKISKICPLLFSIASQTFCNTCCRVLSPLLSISISSSKPAIKQSSFNHNI